METRDNLIGSATRLVQRLGYAGFSYADLSAEVGIRKASIHHHFPSKADLGVEIVNRYRQSFGEELQGILEREATLAGRLEAYAGLYRRGVKAGTSCLCGVLAAEFDGLPRPVQSAIKAFFDDNIAWLVGVVEDARGRGSRKERASAMRQARMILSTLQGAMLMARTQGDPRAFDDAIRAAFSTPET